MTTSAATADTSKPWFPLSVTNTGYSTEDEATATCFCGAVQLAFPTHGPGFVAAFKCNCTDCRRLTATMFASNFTIADEYLKHLRGKENLKAWGQDVTPGSGKKMTNHFCNTCGTLMYRVGEAYPGVRFLRIGTVDDFSLHETKLKPTIEAYTKDRVSWVNAIEGAVQHEGMF